MPVKLPVTAGTDANAPDAALCETKTTIGSPLTANASKHVRYAGGGTACRINGTAANACAAVLYTVKATNGFRSINMRNAVPSAAADGPPLMYVRKPSSATSLRKAKGFTTTEARFYPPPEHSRMKICFCVWRKIPVPAG